MIGFWEQDDVKYIRDKQDVRFVDMEKNVLQILRKDIGKTKLDDLMKKGFVPKIDKTSAFSFWVAHTAWAHKFTPEFKMNLMEMTSGAIRLQSMLLHAYPDFVSTKRKRSRGS